MYGFDGNVNLENWAGLVGFAALSAEEKAKLVQQGLYTPDGVKITPPQTNPDKKEDRLET